MIRPEATSEHPLHGVRLGRMERHLLLHAPRPDTPFGCIINAPDRSVREQLRRGAAKLVSVRLLEQEKVRLYGRARDPRRKGLSFADGCFYTRADSTRAHMVSRNVVWQSPFGWQIVQRYWRQLKRGSSIRWDLLTVQHAYRVAERHSLDRRV
jgi:hypothetical protein